MWAIKKLNFDFKAIKEERLLLMNLGFQFSNRV